MLTPMPMLIAHRGASREAPENTIPAIRRAIELGADGIELDCLLTSDNVPVVTHNDDLSILTDYRGYVHATPFAVVNSLDVRGHVTIPKLTDVLNVIKDHNVLTIVEIKAQPGLATQSARLIGGIIKELKMRGPVTISSSSIRIIREVRRLGLKIPHALIIRQRVLAFIARGFFAKVMGLSEIHPCLEVTTTQLVDLWHRLGLKVSVWTANTPQEFDRCIALGVDGIITDDVALARNYFDKEKPCQKNGNSKTQNSLT